MVITSQDNVNIQLIKKLSDKKYRKKLGMYVIEGDRLVRDAIMHGAQVENVFVRESSADKYSYNNAIIVSDGLFAKISDTVNSQGVIAVVKIAEKQLSKPSGNCLVLDCLQDPGNIGTLIRTAAACNFNDVYLCNCADAYSPKVLRSAMSAHFCINLYECSIEQAFSVLDNVTKVCADMHGENLFECSMRNNVAVVLGNEGNGVSQYARTNCDVTVSLPMCNNVESLNVAVAGSVMMYCLTNK